MILVGLIIVMGYLVVVPLISVIIDTFVVHPSEALQAGKAPGTYTGYHWKRMFANGESSINLFYKPLLNSIAVGLVTCVISVVVGGSFAWLVTRTDMKFKGVVSTLFMFPFIMPSWTLALVWLNFFKNDYIGGVTGVFTAITGYETTNWFAYGFLPIVIVLGIHYAPFAYIFIGGILRNMDSNLEEAAMILQSSRMQILRKITFPMIIPGIMSTVLLVFSSAVSTFAVPAFLGSPVKFKVISLQIFSNLQGTKPGYGYLLALVLICIGTLVLLINQKVVGNRKSYTTVTGKSSNTSLIKLKKYKYPVHALVFLFLALITVVPLLSFALESVLKVSGDYSLSNFTLHFWTGLGDPHIASGEPGILRSKDIWLSLKNSFSLSILAAFFAGTVGILAGYAIIKKRGTRLSGFVNQLTFFPYLIPSIGLAAIFLSMFSVQRGIIPSLYGTFALLVLIGAVKYLPYGARASSSAMLQLGNEIEEAAEIYGIPWHKRMLRIIFPIQKASFLSGYLLPFITGMRELSLFVLLVTPSTSLLTTMMFQYNERGWDQYSNAIILLIVVVVLIANYIINKITGASIDKGIGG